jgi:hypothetical protein
MHYHAATILNISLYLNSPRLIKPFRTDGEIYWIRELGTEMKLQICRLILIKKNKTHKNLLVNKTTDPILEWSLIGILSKLCPTVY